MLLAAIFIFFVIVPVVAALNGDSSLLKGILKYVGGFFTVILILFLLTQPAFWVVAGVALFVGIAAYAVSKHHERASVDGKSTIEGDDAQNAGTPPFETENGEAAADQETFSEAEGGQLLIGVGGQSPAANDSGVQMATECATKSGDGDSGAVSDDIQPKGARRSNERYGNLKFALKSTGIYIGTLAVIVFVGFLLYTLHFSDSKAFNYQFTHLLALLSIAFVPYFITVIVFTARGGAWRSNIRSKVKDLSKSKPVLFRTGVISISVLAAAFVGLLCSCPHSHWAEATCSQPRHCIDCGKEEGKARNHQWVGATCEEPKRCSRCGVTDGDPLGHEWFVTASGTEVCKRCWVGWDEASDPKSSATSE